MEINPCRGASISHCIPESVRFDVKRMSTVKGEVVIQNDAGMHLRPAAAFVQAANKHKGCEILVATGGQRVNGKSIMGLVMLAAAKGTPLTIEVTGDGSDDALNELITLVNDKFNTD